MSNLSSPVQIDGSFGEGGGQIIRTSLSLAAMTGRAVEISNVRGRRTKPGLQPQHLTAVRAAAALCEAVVSGDAVASQFLRFEPQAPVRAGEYRFDIGTAGATSLVLPLCLAPGWSQWSTPLVTEHLRTVLQVAQLFLAIEVELDEHEDGSGTVRLRGIGAE